MGAARDFLAHLAGNPGGLARAAGWACGANLVDAADAVRRNGTPRACLWGADDTLLPLWVGERTAAALEAPLLVVRGRTADDRVGHDWPWRRPTHFAKPIDQAIASAVAR